MAPTPDVLVVGALTARVCRSATRQCASTPPRPDVYGLIEPALKGEFEALERFLSRQQTRIGLVVDCTAMTAYTPEARALFVEWHRANRECIHAVGIVTTNMLWHMIVRTMALATMRPFVELERAIAFVS
jgi:hypothetical protein